MMRRLPNLPDKEFERLLKIAPLSTVECLIKYKDEILLTRRKSKPFVGYWHIPGGFVGYGETFEEAVKRIAKKETGLNVIVKKFLGYYDKPRLDPRGHILGHIFLAEIVSGKLKQDKNAKEIGFFKKIPRKTIFYHRAILKRIGYR